MLEHIQLAINGEPRSVTTVQMEKVAEDSMGHRVNQSLKFVSQLRVNFILGVVSYTSNVRGRTAFGEMLFGKLTFGETPYNL